MTDPAYCLHRNVVEHPVPRFIPVVVNSVRGPGHRQVRWAPWRDAFPVFRCLDCDLRGEMVPR